MRRFDLHLLKIFIGPSNPFTLLVFEAFDDLIRRDLLLIGFRDFLVTDWAQIGGPQLAETDFLFLRRGIDRDGDVNETEIDAALPDRAHSPERSAITGPSVKPN